MFGLWWITLASALPPAPRIALGLDVTEDPSGVLCYPSGLQVRVAQREGSELAAVSMVLEGGASLEDDTTRSAAHMLEHLWFQSSPGGGPTVWRRGSGLALDATTRADVTTFTTVGAAADLDRLLALEAARLTDPLQGVTDAQLAHEKRIVAAELGLRGEHSARLAAQSLGALLYDSSHPYFQTIAGSADVDARGQRLALAENPLETHLAGVLGEKLALVSTSVDLDTGRSREGHEREGEGHQEAGANHPCQLSQAPFQQADRRISGSYQ